MTKKVPQTIKMLIDIKSYWENIYRENSTNLTGWFQEFPEVSLELINSAQLSKKARIIDIGGGDSLLVDHLLELGYENITILDLSDIAIERAKKRLGEKSSKVNWICADILNFESFEKYDLWYDRACFHFLTEEEEVNQYYKIIQDLMAENGTVVLGTFSKSGPSKCSGLPIRQYNSFELNQIVSQDFELLQSLETVHTTPSNAKQNYVFCRFIRN